MYKSHVIESATNQTPTKPIALATPAVRARPPGGLPTRAITLHPNTLDTLCSTHLTDLDSAIGHHAGRNELLQRARHVDMLTSHVHTPCTRHLVGHLLHRHGLGSGHVVHPGAAHRVCAHGIWSRVPHPLAGAQSSHTREQQNGVHERAAEWRARTLPASQQRK